MEVLKFNVDVELVKEFSDSQLAIVNVLCCAVGNNAHNKPISEETIVRASSTLLNKFLVAGFDGEDFLGHEKNQQIIGFFPAENDLKIVEKDDKRLLSANAILSKTYAPWAYECFINKDNLREVSMEISVLETQIKEDGYEWITEFVFNGITVLGDTRTAASAGSEATIIKFSDEYKERCEKLYFEELHQENKRDGETVEFSLNSSQIMEILRSALGDSDVYIEAYDDEYVYIYSYEEGGTYRAKFQFDGEGVVATIDLENKERVVRGGYIVVSASNEGSKEDPDSGGVAMSVTETEEYQAVVAELNNAKVEIEQLSQKIKTYEDAEKERLELEKKNVVKCTLEEDEIVQNFSESKINELLSDSENYSYSNITDWKNKVYAEAFAVVKEKISKQPKIGLSWSNTEKEENENPWNKHF